MSLESSLCKCKALHSCLYKREFTEATEVVVWLCIWKSKSCNKTWHKQILFPHLTQAQTSDLDLLHFVVLSL